MSHHALLVGLGFTTVAILVALTGCSRGSTSHAAFQSGEVELVEQALGMRIPRDATRVCLAFLTEKDDVFLYARVDIPSSALNDILDADEFRRGAVDYHQLHVSGPPDLYNIVWWKVYAPAGDAEEQLWFRLHREGPRATPDVGVIKDARETSIYWSCGSSRSEYTPEFLAFIESHPKQIRASFPLRTRGYEVCRRLQKDGE